MFLKHLNYLIPDLLQYVSTHWHGSTGVYILIVTFYHHYIPPLNLVFFKLLIKYNCFITIHQVTNKHKFVASLNSISLHRFSIQRLHFCAHIPKYNAHRILTFLNSEVSCVCVIQMHYVTVCHNSWIAMSLVNSWTVWSRSFSILRCALRFNYFSV